MLVLIVLFGNLQTVGTFTNTCFRSFSAARVQNGMYLIRLRKQWRRDSVYRSDITKMKQYEGYLVIRISHKRTLLVCLIFRLNVCGSILLFQ